MGLVRRLRVAVVLASGVLASGWSAAQQPGPGGLQLQLVREDSQSYRPLFKVELHNKTAQPITLSLGISVGGPDKRNYAGAIEFEVTDVSGRKRRLSKRDPQYIAGAAGPYIVTVPGGGTFALPGIDLVDYWSHEPGVAILALPVGRYTLSAQYTGRNPNSDSAPTLDQPHPQLFAQNFWTGAIRSNVVVFTLTKAIGDQHAR